MLWILVTVAGYAPWWPNLFSQTENSTIGTTIPYPSVDVIFRVYRASLGLSRFEMLSYPLIVVLMLGGLVEAWRLRRNPFSTALIAIALVTAAQLTYSLVLPRIADFKPVFDAKYTAPFMSGLAFVAALGLVNGTARAWSWVFGRPLSPVISGVGGAFVLSLLAANVLAHYRIAEPEDWRQPAAAIERGATTYAWPNYVLDPVRYYARDDVSYAFLFAPTANVASRGYSPFARGKAKEHINFVGQDRSARHQATIDNIIAASEPYFIVRNALEFPAGLRAWTLETRNIAMYNVELNLDDFTTTNAGYLRLNGSTTVRPKASIDWRNSVLIVEYRDTSTRLTAVHETGASTIPIVGNVRDVGDWSQFTAPIGESTWESTRLDGAAEIRRIEVRTFTTDADVDLLIDETALGRAWFIRFDGLLESVSGSGCFTTSRQLQDNANVEIGVFTLGGIEKVITSFRKSGLLWCGELPVQRPIASLQVQ